MNAKQKRLVKEAAEYAAIAERIMRAKVLVGETGGMWPDYGPAFTEEGAVFFDLMPIPYDSGEHIEDFTVTWDDINNADRVLDLLASKKRVRDAEDVSATRARERANYLRLKAQFEGSDGE